MLLVLLLLPGALAGQALLVSGYNAEMEVYSIGGGPNNHTITKAAAWPVDTNLTWLQVPASGWLEVGASLYATHEVSSFVPGVDPGTLGGAVSRWRREAGGLRREEWVGVGQGPAHLLADTRPDFGGHVYTANYGDGTWSAVSLDLATGELGKVEKTWNYTTASCVPHPGSTRGSHPHQTVVRGPHIWVVDLGCDTIHHHRWNGSVLWEGNSTQLAAGRGPRHMLLHPWRDIALVVCEVQNFLEVYRINPASGALTRLQEVPLTSKTTNYGAEILAVESGQDLNIYISSRGVGMIEFFKLRGTEERVTREQEFLLAGSWPRHMALHPSGRLLAVGDQKGNSVELVNIAPGTPGTGRLSPGAVTTTGDGPTQPSFLAFIDTWDM